MPLYYRLTSHNALLICVVYYVHRSINETERSRHEMTLNIRSIAAVTQLAVSVNWIGAKRTLSHAWEEPNNNPVNLKLFCETAKHTLLRFSLPSNQEMPWTVWGQLPEEIVVSLFRHVLQCNMYGVAGKHQPQARRDIFTYFESDTRPTVAPLRVFLGNDNGLKERGKYRFQYLRECCCIPAISGGELQQKDAL